MNKSSIISELEKLDNVKLKTDVPLKNYTTIKAGGPASLLVIPTNIKALQKILKTTAEAKIDLPIFIMGKGSNVIVSDNGYPGLVINTLELDHADIKKDRIKAECGITLKKLAGMAYEHSLSGLEFAGGIPGTLGGALYMNAGAYGSEIKDLIVKVEAYDYKGKKVILTPENLEFSYRSSIFQKQELAAARIELQLTPASPQKIKNKMRELNKKRRTKQPLQWPSAGSAFKRPPQHYAGTLIENSGLKGYQIGGAQVSRKHAGFIINKNDASARDIKALFDRVQEEVYQNSGIKLEPEPRFLGEF